MQPAVLIRLRPTGPWRYGPGDGGQDGADTLYRSDRLYSAVSLAMQQLGSLDAWLEATAHATRPAVTFSSLFPYQGDTLFAPPPATIWPPPSSLVTTPSPVFLTKIRWTAARFVPLGLIESILMGQAVLADQWMPDPESGCLLRRDRPSASPFRIVVRTRAAVDRVTHSSARPHSVSCVEFEAGSGLWCLARYADSAAESTWSDRIKACFRLLGDTGFGGRRSSGFGQTEAPEFQQGAWPKLVLPKFARISGNGNAAISSDTEPALYWLWSLYSPASTDGVEWGQGDYRLTVRGGRVGSAAGYGAKKKTVRMIAEGSVLAASEEPVGKALDVAPDAFAHPVYRSGLAVALRLPVIEPSEFRGPVELPSDGEALELRPCTDKEDNEPAEQAAAESAVESEVPADEL